MKYFFTTLLIIAIAIMGIIITPNNLYKVWMPKANKFFDNFRNLNVEIQDFFKISLSTKSKTDITSLNYNKLKSIGSKLGVSYTFLIDYIKNTKEYYWLDAALSMANNTLNYNINKFTIMIDSQMLFWSNFIILLTVMILLTFYILANKRHGNNSNPIFPIFAGITTLLITAYTIAINLISYINYLKEPVTTDMLYFNFDSIFYFAFAVVLIQLAFVIFIAINLLDKQKHNLKFAFMWIIPIFVILFNLYKTPNNIKQFQTSMNRINISHELSELSNYQTILLARLRSQIKSQNLTDLSKLDLDKYKNPFNTDYARYKIDIKDSKLIITGESLKKYNGETYKLKTIYDAKEKKVKAETNFKNYI